MSISQFLQTAFFNVALFEMQVPPGRTFWMFPISHFFAMCTEINYCPSHRFFALGMTCTTFSGTVSVTFKKTFVVADSSILKIYVPKWLLWKILIYFFSDFFGNTVSHFFRVCFCPIKKWTLVFKNNIFKHSSTFSILILILWNFSKFLKDILYR